MIREAFCALEFYASGEQEVSKGEWRYFLECLEGKREYNAAAAGSGAHRIERIIDAALDLIDDIRKK